MICTRCGTVQRRETARFCHVCGAAIEPAPAPSQPSHGFRPFTLTPPEPGNNRPGESLGADTNQPETATEAGGRDSIAELAGEAPALPTQSSIANQPQQPADRYADWQQRPSPAPPDQQPPRRQEQASPRFALSDAPVSSEVADWTAAAPPAAQMLAQSSNLSGNQNPHTTPESLTAEPVRAGWHDQQPVWQGSAAQQGPQTLDPVQRRDTIIAESADAYFPERPQPRTPTGHLERESGTPAAQERSFSARQPRQHGMSHDPFGELPGHPPTWEASTSERPTRSTAGPVPASLPRFQTRKQRRLPLGIIVSVGLVLICAVASFGIYTLVSSAGTPEPSAFLTYTDPNHHFSIRYPAVWTVKQLPNGARFADSTNTAEFRITYTANIANQTAQQFADQEAAKEGITTPDSKVFAGQTWVVRSGIVTQTSGIAQDIFIFVTVHNNTIFEIREVAPLDGFKEPNQAVFLPMQQSLVLK